MIPTRRIRHVFLAACMSLSLLAFSARAQAQPAKQEYQPHVGQQGKDVVWVPTPQALVDRMLDMAKVTAKDYVIDLGSGDGRTVITAAKRGAKALGIEYNPDMVELSKRNAEKAGARRKGPFAKADVFKGVFPRATVITICLLPDKNLRRLPKFLNLKPGQGTAANSFNRGNWNPEKTANVSEGCNNWCTAYLWIVPAKVEGTWKLPQGELALKQTFQMVSGTLNTGGNTQQVTNGKLNGNQISFTAGGTQYTGRVNGKTMDGSTKPGGNWHATREGQ